MGCVAGMLLALGLTPAYANFGSTSCGGAPTNCVSLANNKWHAVRFEASLLNNWPAMATATQWSLDNNYNPTDLVAYRDDADPLPDVRVRAFNYPQYPYTSGWVECPSDNTGTGGSHPLMWCRGQILRYNTATASYHNTLTKRRNLACHELAHTVGLRHWDPQHGSSAASCTYSYTDVGPAHLTDHERNQHINPWY